jgi:hypothetical protein
MKIAFFYGLNNFHCIVTNEFRAEEEGKVASFEKMLCANPGTKFSLEKDFYRGVCRKTRLFRRRSVRIEIYRAKYISPARAGQTTGD